MADGKRITDIYELDTRANTRGLNRVGSAFDDLVDDINDVARETKDVTKETDKADDSLKDLRKEAGRTETAFDDLGDELNNSEGAFGRVTDAALGTFGALAGMQVVEQVTSAITSFGGEILAMDGELRRFQAATGATAEEMAVFETSIKDVYAAGRGEDFADVTASMQSVATITDLAGQELTDFTSNALVFRDVVGTDIPEYTRAAEQAMANFGTSSVEVADLIAYAYQQTGDPAEDLVDTVNEYSSTFANAGYDAEQMFEILINGNEAGIFSFDKTADAVREFGIRTREGTEAVELAYNDLIAASDEWTVQAADGTTLVIDSYDDLQTALVDGSITMADAGDLVSESLQAIEDPLERNRIAAEIIGTQYEDLGEGIFQAMDLSEEGITDATGAADRMAETMDGGLGNAWERLTRTAKMSIAEAISPFAHELVDAAIPAIEDLSVWLSDEAIPAIVDFVKMVGPTVAKVVTGFVKVIGGAIKAIVEFVSENQTIAKVIGFVVLAIGAIISVFNIVMGVIGTVTALWASLSAAATGLGVVLTFLMSPIGLLIAAIALFAIAWKTNFLGVQDVVKAVVEWLIEKLVSLWTTVQPALAALYDWFVVTALPAIGNALTWFKDNVLTPAIDALAAIWTAVQPALQSLWDWFVTDGLPFMRSAINIYLTEYVQPMIDLLKSIWETVSPALSSLYNWFVTVGIPFMRTAIQSYMDNYVQPMIDLLKGIWETVSPALGSLYDWFVVTGMPAIKNILNEVVGAINLVIERANRIWDAASGSWNDFKDNVTSALQPVLSILQDVRDAIQRIIDKAGDMAGLDIGGMAGGLLSGGLGLLTGASGITWSGQGPVNEVAGIFHRQEAVVPHDGMKVIPSPRGLMIEGTAIAPEQQGMSAMPVQWGSQTVEVTVPLYMDGKKIAEALHKVMLNSSPITSRAISRNRG